MAKKRVVTPWGESWVDDTQTPAPAPAPVQKFTPIDVQTKAQDAITPKYTQNLLNTQEQAAQKVNLPVQSGNNFTVPQGGDVRIKSTTIGTPSEQAQSIIPVARQDQTNKDGVANASVQGGQGSIVTPLPTSATRTNPVVSKSIPEKAPEKVNLIGVTPPTSNADELQNFVDEWSVRVSNGEQMTPQEKLQLIQAQRQLQKLQAPSATTNPFDAQITRQNDLKTQRQQALQAQTDTLIQSEQQRQAKAADIAVADAQQAGERQKQAAQAVLSFSGFGRSTFSAQQQADIQASVERNIASIQAQKDAAVEQYRAKLNNATAEEMKMYDDNIARLELESSNYLIELAGKIDTYNRQVNADYATKIDDILKLSEQNAPITPLTDAEKQQASAYAGMLVKDNGDINQEILKLVPPKLLSEALSQGAKLKGSMGSEKTVKDANDNVFQYNPQTGRYDIPVGEKAKAKSEWASMTGGGLYNKATGEVKQVGNISNAPTQQATNFLSMSVGEKSDFECGGYASRATGNNGTPGGNDKQARIRAFSSKEPKEGGMVLFAGDGYDKTYGHIAVVTAVNGDGTMTVKESNLNGDKKITERTIPISSATGFFNNTPLAKGQNVTQYNSALLPAYTAYIEQNKAPTKDQVEALGGIEQFAKNAYEAYTQNANKKLNSVGFKLTSPDMFATMTPDQRKQFNNETKTVRGAIDKIDKIINTIDTEGLPAQSWMGKGKALKQNITDLQLQLKNEGVYNLGVLNGPDLDLINSVIPQIGPESWATLGKDGYINMLKNARQMYIDQINSNNADKGLEFNPGEPKIATNTNSKSPTAPAKATPKVDDYLKQFGIK